MATPDLRLTKRRLHETNLNLVIAKKGKVVFETGAHGLGGLLLAIERFGKELVGSSVADKTVGRAVALLCAYSQVASVFAVTLSREGVFILRNNGILCEYENLVPNILNDDCTDVCPFEKLVAGLVSPNEAYLKLKHRIRSSMDTTP